MGKILDELLGGPAAKRQMPPEQPQQRTLGEELSRAGQEFREMGRSAVRAFTGEGRVGPDLPELIDAPHAMYPGQALKMTGALATTLDPEDMAVIAVKTLPGATLRRDSKNNPIIRWKDKSYYVNRPGFSKTDAWQFALQSLAFGPSARAGMGAQTATRAAVKTGLATGATSLGLDVASGALGSESAPDLGDAATAALVGAGFSFASPYAKRAWQAVFGNPSFIDRSTGQLTERGIRAARAAGLDPDEMTQKLRQAFGREISSTVAPVTAGGRALSQVSGVPLTRGQTTGNLKHLGQEEGLRRGTYGQEPMAVMRQFEDKQADAFAQAARDVVPGRMTSPAEGAEAVLQGARREAGRLDERIGQAYRDAAGFHSEIADPSVMKDLGKRAKAYLAEEGHVYLPAELYPATRASLKVLNRLAPRTKVTPEGQKVKITPKNLNIQRLERERRVLNKYIGAAKNPSDKQAAIVVKDAYDEWIDEAVDQALFTGDPQALEAIKKARALRVEKRMKFEPRTQRASEDPAGKVIQRFIREDPTPEQAANWMFGKAKLGAQENAAQVAQRLQDIFGRNSVEWMQLREAAWLKLTMDRQGRLKAPKAMRDAIAEANTQHPTLMQTLFTEEERLFMQNLGAVARRMGLPEGMTAKESTVQLFRTMRDFIRGVAVGMRFKGEFVTGAGLFSLARYMPTMAGHSRARGALRNWPKPPQQAPVVTPGAITLERQQPEAR